jgi:hypothetical protein
MELDKVEAPVLRRDEHHLRMDASVNSICHAEMSTRIAAVVCLSEHVGFQWFRNERSGLKSRSCWLKLEPEVG